MNFKRNVILTAVGATLLLANTKLTAQETTENPLDTLARSLQNITDDLNKIKRLKITGYIQPQYQYIDSAGAPSFAGGDFVNGTSKYYTLNSLQLPSIKYNAQQGQWESAIEIIAFLCKGQSSNILSFSNL